MPHPHPQPTRPCRHEKDTAILQALQPQPNPPPTTHTHTLVLTPTHPPTRRHEKDTAVILGKERERLEEEAAAAVAAAERLEQVLQAVSSAASQPHRWAPSCLALHVHLQRPTGGRCPGLRCMCVCSASQPGQGLCRPGMLDLHAT